SAECPSDRRHITAARQYSSSNGAGSGPKKSAARALTVSRQTCACSSVNPAGGSRCTLGGDRATTLSLITVPLSLEIVTVSLKRGDRKSTRLNSSHVKISYAVFCLKKKRRQSAQRNLSIQ